MAAITSANVTLIRQWEVGDRQGKLVEICGVFDVALTAQGGTAGDIPATAFGWTKIFWAVCDRAIDGSAALSAVIPVVEVGDTGILTIDMENATDATRGNPTNYTGTIRVRMGGRR